MKRLVFVIFMLFGLLFQSSANGPVATIAHAFNTSNSALIASYFDSNIDLKILEDENIYSRQQARVLLFNFMNGAKPTGFVLKHEGGPENARFAIGDLSAKGKVYRVYYLLKEKNSTTYIYKLRIELDD